MTFDAVLIVSFGGPEGPDDVLPFLANVTRGRGVPAERLARVASQYDLVGGVSPLNGQNRALVAALRAELVRRGPDLPVYWGNRNWHPFLADTVRQMAADGIRHAAAFVTSAYGSYSSCRQYLEDIARAREEVGPGAPRIDKLRLFYNHPGFIAPQADLLARALEGRPSRGTATRVLFTAHSLPQVMAEQCDYSEQLAEAARLVIEQVPSAGRWELVYQSRSGPPAQPWLGPDIVDRLAELRAERVTTAVVVPIGFVADHMEVVYDLDTRARQAAEAAGLAFVRVPTVGTDPRFVAMIRDLVVEREQFGRAQVGRAQVGRAALGALGPAPDDCPPGCCPAPRPPPAPSVGLG